MARLAERLNFSKGVTSSTSIEIDNRKDVNFYETLCLYCASNDISLSDVSHADFEGAVATMEDYNIVDRGIYNFWIDV